MLRTRDDTIYSTTGYRDWTLQGIVTRRPGWAADDTVSVHTNCPNVPNRVISKSSIRGARKLGMGSVVADQPQIPTWTVAGSNGSVYNVKLEGRKYSCSCPGFQFRSHCRHIEQIRNQKVAA